VCQPEISAWPRTPATRKIKGQNGEPEPEPEAEPEPEHPTAAQSETAEWLPSA
jgi:hypothetical protein